MRGRPRAAQSHCCPRGKRSPRRQGLSDAAGLSATRPLRAIVSGAVARRGATGGLHSLTAAAALPKGAHHHALPHATGGTRPAHWGRTEPSPAAPRCGPCSHGMGVLGGPARGLSPPCTQDHCGPLAKGWRARHAPQNRVCDLRSSGRAPGGVSCVLTGLQRAAQRPSTTGDRQCFGDLLRWPQAGCLGSSSRKHDPPTPVLPQRPETGSIPRPSSDAGAAPGRRGCLGAGALRGDGLGLGPSLTLGSRLPRPPSLPG